MNTFSSPELPQMNEQVFLAYLREHKPYLYDVEMGVSSVIQETGFGEVVFSLRIMNGLVEKGTGNITTDKFYVRREENRFV